MLCAFLLPIGRNYQKTGENAYFAAAGNDKLNLLARAPRKV